MSNLALFRPFAGVPEPAIDSPWTLQTKHYTIAKIRAEIPPVNGGGRAVSVIGSRPHRRAFYRLHIGEADTPMCKTGMPQDAQGSVAARSGLRLDRQD